MKSEVIDKAVRAAGGPTALANALGIKMESIYSWTRIPAERVFGVEAATGISREELRPDLYRKPDPAPASTQPEARG